MRSVQWRLQLLLLSLFLMIGAIGVLWNYQSSSSYEPLRGSPVENFRLHDHKGVSHELARYRNKKAIVLISHGNGCPIVRNLLAKVEELNRAYGPEGVVFFWVNANPQDDRLNLQEEAKSYGIEVAILKDESQVISNSLGFERTAEALVIDPKSWSVVYRGSVSDQYDYGVKREKSEKNYLDEALKAFLNGLSIGEAGEVKGCMISYDTAFDQKVQISYESQVAPILANRCLSCHTKQGPGPWAMENHDQVKGWRSMIREVLRTQRMPPWPADPHYGKFETDISIPPDELRTLVLWIEKGEFPNPAKDPLPAAYARKLLQLSKEWALGEPDLVIDLDEQQLPANGFIDYRYMKRASPVEETVWLRAVDLKPSNRLVTHHAGAFQRLPEEDLIGKTNVFKDNFLAGYIPGTPPIAFPKGTGKRLHHKGELTFQFHYNATGKPEIDRPQLALYFNKASKIEELITGSIFNNDLRIPPNEENYEIEGHLAFDTDVTIYGLVPHMHYRGKSMKYEIELPNGRRETLLSVTNYLFDFQWLYRFSEPRRFPAGSRLWCKAVYDNSPENPSNPDPSSEITWGEQTSDEMFLCLVNYVKHEKPR